MDGVRFGLGANGTGFGTGARAHSTRGAPRDKAVPVFSLGWRTLNIHFFAMVNAVFASVGCWSAHGLQYHVHLRRCAARDHRIVPVVDEQ